MSTLSDIETREDLERLMRYFYEIMLQDQLMAPLFLEVAGIKLEEHFPKLVEFWHSLLFMTGAYKRNVMNIHFDLHHKSPLQKIHFQRWIGYFDQAVDSMFSGPRSELIKDRARGIALLMEHKILVQGKTGA